MPWKIQLFYVYLGTSFENFTHAGPASDHLPRDIPCITPALCLRIYLTRPYLQGYKVTLYSAHRVVQLNLMALYQSSPDSVSPEPIIIHNTTIPFRNLYFWKLPARTDLIPNCKLVIVLYIRYRLHTSPEKHEMWRIFLLSISLSLPRHRPNPNPCADQDPDPKNLFRILIQTKKHPMYLPIFLFFSSHRRTAINLRIRSTPSLGNWHNPW